MTTKELVEYLIPRLNDVYADENGDIRIDINLPVAKDNYEKLSELANRKDKKETIFERIKELWNYNLLLEEYVIRQYRVVLDCYLSLILVKK